MYINSGKGSFYHKKLRQSIGNVRVLGKAKDIRKIKTMYCLNGASTKTTFLHFNITFCEKIISFSKPSKVSFLFT